MSILTRPRRSTSRPATIRPVPASFGAGILAAEPPADDWGVRFDAAQRRYRESLRKPAPVDDEQAELEALESWLVAEEERLEREYEQAMPMPAPTPKPARKSGRHVSPVDAAWHLGFGLGRACENAAPPARFTRDECIAFQAGYDQGLAELRDEERDRLEAWLIEKDRENAMDGLHDDAEYAEARLVRRPLYSEA
jgi:hypothetical protein